MAKKTHVMTPARQEALKKATAASKAAALAKTVKKDPVPSKDKPAVTKTEVVHESSKYHIWDVYGVNFFLDDNLVPTRRVGVIEVTSDHDTANEPELRNKLIKDAEDQLIKDGFFMTDVDAMEEALANVEPVLDTIRHKTKYGEMCPRCTSEELNTVIQMMEYLRGWRNRRFELAEMLGGTANLPPVIPQDYKENWHIENHHLVPNKKMPTEIHTKVIKLGTEDSKKAIKEICKQICGKLPAPAIEKKPSEKKDK